MRDDTMSIGGFVQQPNLIVLNVYVDNIMGDYR